MEWDWIVWMCFFPTVQQAFLVSSAILVPSVFIRLIVLYGGLSKLVINILATALGVLVLWWFYGTSVSFFLILSLIVYILLIVSPRYKGCVVAVCCVVFILTCELLIASKEEWHRVRGSFLVVVMKNIALAFDLDSHSLSKPDLLSYTSYCFFPATTVFGPFLTYSEHSKFLHRTPLTKQWLLVLLKSLVLSAICLGMSVCVIPFLFTEPEYNKWLAAFSTAASFRYSHYFVSFLSESSTVASGIGYHLQQDNTITWSKFHVVHPLAIEIPRSMPLIVTHWNLPMHLFLKNYVFKPSRYYLGQFSAILITFLASSLLHGFHFQLTAVLLSIGVYAYIESVFRKKLSMKFDACILDRPCNKNCGHRFTNGWWVLAFNASFTVLNIFHLAYLGVMFGGANEEESELQLEGYSLLHTIKKWTHLGFLSHWVALFTLLLSYFVV